MEIKNLGVIDGITIDFKDLLIFTGANNTGKTYVSYLLYGILSEIMNTQIKIVSSADVDSLFEITSGPVQIRKQKSEVITTILDAIIKRIHKKQHDIAVENFKTNKQNFEKLAVTITDNDIKNLFAKDLQAKCNYTEGTENSEFSISITEEQDELVITINNLSELGHADETFRNEMASRMVNSILMKALFGAHSVFYFPAERLGINVFKNELNNKRLNTYNTFINAAQLASLTEDDEHNEVAKKLFDSNLASLFNKTSYLYPKPISDYIDFLTLMSSKTQLEQSHDIAEYIRKEILNGTFKFTDDDKNVVFVPNGGANAKEIPFHVTSSSIKSLYGLDYLIDQKAVKGDIIIIDEPELSLHPNNQLKLAKVICDLVESGFKLIISTHSDLLVREITNIVLENKLASSNDKMSEAMVGIYDFSQGGQIQELGAITELYALNNFDDAVFATQNRYNEILEKIAQQADESN